MATYNIRVTSNGSTNFVFNGTHEGGDLIDANDPTLIFTVGDLVVFEFNQTSTHPFLIQGLGSFGPHTGGTYTWQVTLAGTATYVCTNHQEMSGQIIVNDIPPPVGSSICLSGNVEVTVVDNIFYFNGRSSSDYRFSVTEGVYTFLNVPEEHPMAFYSINGSLTYSGTVNQGIKSGQDGIPRIYFYGTLTLTISEDFGTTSYECYNNGYMGGENNLSFDPTCKIPNPITTTTIPPETGTETTTTTVPPLSISLEISNTRYAKISVNRAFQTANDLFSEHRIYWSLKNRENSTRIQVDDLFYSDASSQQTSQAFVSLNEDSFEPATEYEFVARAYYTNNPNTYIESDIFYFTTPEAPTTTTTTTTTDSPYDIIFSQDDLDICPCGIITVPAGSFFKETGGLKVMIFDENLEHHSDLLHDKEVLIFREQELITASSFITEHVTPKNIVLYIDTTDFMRWEIENVICVTVRSKNHGIVLARKEFGSFGTKIFTKKSDSIDKPSLEMISLSNIDLFQDSLVIQISSVCNYKTLPCCDSLPATIIVSGEPIICLPLNDNYQDIEYITTQPPVIETVSFIDNIYANVNEQTHIVTLCAKAKSSFGNDIKYFLDIVDGDCYTRLTKPLVSKSDETFCVTDDTFGTNQYRFTIFSPVKTFSQTITVDNPIPESEKPEEDKVYTTAPPIPSPTLFDIAYLNGSPAQLEFTWNLRNSIQDISTVAIFYGPVNNPAANSLIFTSDFEQLENGYTFTPQNVVSCENYKGYIAIKSNDPENHNINKYEYSNVISFVSAEACSAPTDLLTVNNGTTMDVSWNRPANDGGCPDIEYEISYRKFTDVDYTVFGNKITSTSTTITGLDPSSNYIVKICPYTTFGIGKCAIGSAWIQVGEHITSDYESTFSHGGLNQIAKVNDDATKILFGGYTSSVGYFSLYEFNNTVVNPNNACVWSPSLQVNYPISNWTFTNGFFSESGNSLVVYSNDLSNPIGYSKSENSWINDNLSIPTNPYYFVPFKVKEDLSYAAAMDRMIYYQTPSSTSVIDVSSYIPPENSSHYYYINSHDIAYNANSNKVAIIYQEENKETYFSNHYLKIMNISSTSPTSLDNVVEFFILSSDYSGLSVQNKVFVSDDGTEILVLQEYYDFGAYPAAMRLDTIRFKEINGSWQKINESTIGSWVDVTYTYSLCPVVSRDTNNVCVNLIIFTENEMLEILIVFYWDGTEWSQKGNYIEKRFGNNQQAFYCSSTFISPLGDVVGYAARPDYPPYFHEYHIYRYELSNIDFPCT